MSNIKSNKKPISEKPVKAVIKEITQDNIYSNPLQLPASLQAELKKKKLVPRFINAGALYKNQGYNKAGWRPYKPECDIIRKSMSEFHQGSDPTGTFRRGDCILAVKSEDEVRDHKTYLRQKADMYKGYTKQKAKELRQIAGKTGGITIHEGYDENE